MQTWMRRPTSVIAGKADMARTYQCVSTRCGHTRAGGEGLDTIGSRPSVLAGSTAWKAEAGVGDPGLRFQD